MSRRFLLYLSPVVVFALAALMVYGDIVGATVSTDKTKYSVGETMIVSGSGFSAGNPVNISVLRPDHQTDYVLYVVANSSGAFTANYTASLPLVPGRYKITATDGSSSATTASTEADAAAADLDQCRNGGSTSPSACVGSQWENGNVNATQAHMIEGWSVPYRMKFTEVPAGSQWTVDIGYDITQNGVHALDFLTRYNRLDDPSHTFFFGHAPECVDPTDGFGNFGGTPGICDNITPTSTKAILKPALPDSTPTIDQGPPCTPAVGGGAVSCPGTTFDAISTPLPGQAYFSMWGGMIDDVHYVYQANGDETRIRVVFTSSATDGNVVLSWGGHIARQQDWGIGNSAVAINGSPYHMRLKGFCSGTGPFRNDHCDDGGNQDRALQAGAVIPFPLLTLVKVVHNNNGGTKTIADFPLTATSSSQTITGVSGTSDVTTAVMLPGTYALSEQTQDGYTASDWVCGGGAQSGASITLALGQTATCTITNSDKPAHLIVIKHVINDSGGTKHAGDFTTTITGVTTANPTAAGAESPGVDNVLTSVGSYSVDEGAHDGYDKTLSADCSGTIAMGQTKTCTITNDDQATHLIVIKHVINDNGGTKHAGDFTTTITGVTTANPSAAGAESPGVDNVLTSVGSYSVDEGAHDGYDKTLSTDCSGTIALGQTKTCTITNDDRAAHLIVIKHVINDNGGTKHAGDFTTTITGVTTANPSAAGVESPGVDNVLTSVGSYSVDEGAHDGYDKTLSADCSGTIALGQTKTCTITNDDQAAHLIVIKHVINDNGGGKAASDFTTTISGVTTATPSAAGAESPGVNNTLTTVGSYSVDEGAHVGYDKTLSADCSGAIALGETKTCTITNDDQAAHLIVIKHVINDNGGGKAAADFTTTITGVTTANPSAAGAESPGVNNTLTTVGAYSVDEGAHVGYDKTLSADCSGAIALGETKTCTITNDDQAAHLIVIKHVINDNGGGKAAADFTTTITGVTTANPSAAGAESPGVNNTLTTVGAYSVDEGAHDGYDKTLSADCSGTIALGQTKTCTITNNDQAAHLIVIKHVINDNGGGKVAGNFTTTITGVTTATPSASGAESPGVDNVLTSVGSYSVDEGAHDGYDKTLSADCSGAIALGQTKTCTITNNDQAAHLIVIKHVINDSGGTKHAGDFTTTITGVTTANPTAAGAESPGVDNVLTSVGSYSVDEGAHVGYDKTLSADCSGTIALGQTKTCTITNNDQAAHLIVIKHVINDNGGGKVAGNFTTTITGVTTATPSAPGAESPGVDNVLTSVGSYSVDEGAHDGYDKTLSTDCSGTIASGQTKTCTITNNDQATHLIVIKHVINDNGGGRVAGNFTTTITGVTTANPSAAGAESPGVDNVLTSVGSYSVDEGAHDGYDKTLSTDCSGTIALGQTKTCTITNNDQAAHLIVIKHVINDNGGGKVAGNFTTTITGVTTANPSAAGAESPGVNNVLTSVGSYSVDEGAHDGYDKTLSTDCSGTIALGQTKTCTITNNDQAASLILLKNVTNTHGGVATEASFKLAAAGPTSIGNVTGARTPSAANTFAVNAGQYTLNESSMPGYAAAPLPLQCQGVIPSGNQITLGVGQSATCTFFNVDVGGTIIIRKISDPANTGSFAFAATGAAPYAGFTLAGGASNTQSGLSAGPYTAKESTQLGWILTGIGADPANPINPNACTVAGTGGSSGSGDLNTQTASISLKNGDTVTCVFENSGAGVSRTQGFWATHSQLANLAWFGGSGYGHTFPGVAGVAGIGNTTLCARPLDTIGKVEGGFWSGVSTTSTGGKRASLDQARMQLLQQLLAAELNASAFGSVPSGGSGMFATWEAAYCGTNTKTIQTAQQGAGSFNSTGDNSTFTPGTAADSKTGRAIANQAFWDILP